MDCSILVRGLTSEHSKGRLVSLFESQQSGGGKVVAVDIDTEKSEAIITFFEQRGKKICSSYV